MKISTLALGGLAALSLAGASLAQPAAPPADARRPPVGERMQRPDPAQMAERHAQRLRDTLQLRPEQEPALKAYVASLQSLRPQPPGGPRAGRPDPAARTTPQRLDEARQRMAERQGRFDQMAQATLRFYGQLNPAQQKAFDAQHGPGKRFAGPGKRGFRPGMTGHRVPMGGPLGGPPPAA